MKIKKVKDIIIFKDAHYNAFSNVLRKKKTEPLWMASDKLWTDKERRTWDKKANALYDNFIYGIQDPCLNILENETIFCPFYLCKVFKKEDVKEFLPGDRVFGYDWVGRLAEVYSIKTHKGEMKVSIILKMQNCPQ